MSYYYSDGRPKTRTKWSMTKKKWDAYHKRTRALKSVQASQQRVKWYMPGNKLRFIPRVAQDTTRAFVRFMNEPRVKEALRVGSSVFVNSEPFMKQPSKWNAARAIVGTLKSYIDDVEIWPDTFFEARDSGWSTFAEWRVAAIVVAALAHIENEPQVIKTADSSSLVHVHEFEDFKIGYVLNIKTHSPGSEVFVSGPKEKAMAVLNEAIWGMVKGRVALLRLASLTEGPRAMLIEEDVSGFPLESKKATDYSTYLKRCIDAGINRSVMLYGPPGTGKSTMARAVVQNLGYKSLRIRVEDIQHLENSTILDLLETLAPDVIVFDDFDRSMNQVKLLEMLESLQKRVKVVLATVNNRNALDEALLRPGRFDEIMLVDKMDEAVVRKMLGASCEDLYETVKDWPIAYINEIVQRRTFLTKEEALDSLEELISRVARLKKDIDNETNKDDLESLFIRRIAKLKGVSLDDDDGEDEKPNGKASGGPLDGDDDETGDQTSPNALS